MPDHFPPNGAYAVDDPYRPGTLSYWVLRGRGLEAWPVSSDGKYGPPRPPKTTPGGSVEQRRDAMRFWRARLAEYRDAVLAAIAANPDAAAARFVANTSRCHRCRGYFHAEHLDESAAAGRGRAAGELTEDQRNAMVAALRRGGFPEALISEALAMPPGAVNRAARKGGVGAPLKPRGRSGIAAVHSVAMTTDRDNAGHDNTRALEAPGHAEPIGREQAVAVFRSAALAAVAMVTRDLDEVSIPAAALLEDAALEVVAELLAVFASTLLAVTLPPDGARELLTRLARCAAEDPQE